MLRKVVSWLKIETFLFGAGMSALFCLAFFSLRTDANSDPKFNFVVSQAILQEGTVRLDAYKDDVVLGQPFSTWRNTLIIEEVNGHIYHFFPVGPSILSLPVVWVANQFGADMREPGPNYQLQRWLSALSVMLNYGLIFKLTRLFFPTKHSFVLTTVLILGSSMISTMGTALWTLNFSTIFMGWSCLLLVRYEKGAGELRPFLLGVLLFLTYFMRASSAAFILAVFLYLLLKRAWRALFIVSAVAGTGFLLFVSWSYVEYGVPLPGYYALNRFEQSFAPFWVALYGNLLSPSRGVFVFQPYFLLILPALFMVRQKIKQQPLVLFCLSWFVLQVLISSRAVAWWGGHSYGSRILTDGLVGLYLLLVVLWHQLAPTLSINRQRTVGWLFVIIGGWAIFVHSFQGLYNKNTGRWNNYTEPVPTPPFSGLGDMFNWRYAQFLASNERLCMIEAERMAAILPHDTTLMLYEWNTAVSPIADSHQNMRHFARLSAEPPPIDLPPAEFAPIENVHHAFLPRLNTNPLQSLNQAIFIGWENGLNAQSGRWSHCKRADIVMRLGELAGASAQMNLTLEASAFGEQNVTVLVNETAVGSVVIGDEVETAVFQFPTAHLIPNAQNKITFHTPNAAYTSFKDQRRLGISFQSLTLKPDQVETPSHSTESSQNPPNAYP